MNERAPIPVRGHEHSLGLYHPKLVTVPSFDGRKRLVAEPPDESDVRADDEELTEHLRDLGYAV